MNLQDFDQCYVQVRAKPDKCSDEQEFPNARLLSDISVLSSAYLDDNANQRFNSAPSNRVDLYGPV